MFAPLPRDAAVLTARSGMEVVIVPRGASIAAMRLPVDGDMVDVVLPRHKASATACDTYFLGTTVGRYANRIAAGRYRQGDLQVQLETDPAHAGHCLHGGPLGLSVQRFAIESNHDRATCRFVSPHGAAGFPGELRIRVDYRLIEDSTLAIDFVATTDRTTIVNLANHAYFTLGEPRVDDLWLRIHADEVTAVDASLIPTGALQNVAGTAYDFRDTVRLGGHPTGETNGRYDINYVLHGSPGRLRPAAELSSPDQQVRLEVLTTQPGLQLYTGDHLGAPFVPRQGVCLEAQNFPDAPNQPGFPSAVLRPDETYRQRTLYRFTQR